jgi:hypothetical protein
VPSGVYNRLAAVQFGGIAATAQSTTKNIAVGRCTALLVYIFYISYSFFLTKIAVQPCRKK